MKNYEEKEKKLEIVIKKLNSMSNEVVKIDIFDILGDHVKTVLNEKQSIGYKTIIWDGTNDKNKTVPTGIYYCTVSTSRFSEINKMVLIK